MLAAMTAPAALTIVCGVTQDRLEDPMLTSALTVLRRHTPLLAPVAAAITASAAVAGIALATSSTGTGKTTTRTTGSPPSSITVGLAAPAGVALQSAIVDVVHSVSHAVVQIEDQQGLGSGIVLDAAGDIVTDNHVVSGASSFTVTTSNGKTVPGQARRLVSARRSRRDQGLRRAPEAGNLRRLVEAQRWRPGDRDRQPAG